MTLGATLVSHQFRGTFLIRSNQEQIHGDEISRESNAKDVKGYFGEVDRYTSMYSICIREDIIEIVTFRFRYSNIQYSNIKYFPPGSSFSLYANGQFSETIQHRKKEV